MSNEVIVSEQYTSAVSLNQKIKAHAHAAHESLLEVCKGLKEMRDGKLYKELGYQNFEDYTENEVGIKRIQAHKYISILEKLSDENVSSMKHFGMAKLYLLSALSEEERTELTQTTDLENTTVKELKMQIKTLKNDKERLREESCSNAKKAVELKEDNEELTDKIRSLEAEIKDLESRPVEVAVHESHEVENLQKAMRELNRQTEEQIAEITNENAQHIISLNRKHKEEMDELRSDYEKRLAEIPQAETVPDTKEVFKAHFTTVADAVNRLFMFVSTHNDAVFREKTKALFAQVDAELNKLEN